MYSTTIRSNRFALMTCVALAAVLVLGFAAASPAFAAAKKPMIVTQDCRQGMHLEFTLHLRNGLAPDCLTGSTPVTGLAAVQEQYVEEGSNLQFDLIWGRDNTRIAASQANFIPVSGASAVPPRAVEEGQNLQFDLMWGKGNTASPANLVPVTGSASDFGTYYWLMVGPAGEQPVNTGK